jgi:hypothetical protein
MAIHLPLSLILLVVTHLLMVMFLLPYSAHHQKFRPVRVIVVRVVQGVQVVSATIFVNIQVIAVQIKVYTALLMLCSQDHQQLLEQQQLLPAWATPPHHVQHRTCMHKVLLRGIMHRVQIRTYKRVLHHPLLTQEVDILHLTFHHRNLHHMCQHQTKHLVKVTAWKGRLGGQDAFVMTAV